MTEHFPPRLPQLFRVGEIVKSLLNQNQQAKKMQEKMALVEGQENYLKQLVEFQKFNLRRSEMLVELSDILKKFPRGLPNSEVTQAMMKVQRDLNSATSELERVQQMLKDENPLQQAIQEGTGEGSERQPASVTMDSRRSQNSPPEDIQEPSRPVGLTQPQSGIPENKTELTQGSEKTQINQNLKSANDPNKGSVSSSSSAQAFNSNSRGEVNTGNDDVSGKVSNPVLAKPPTVLPQKKVGN